MSKGGGGGEGIRDNEETQEAREGCGSGYHRSGYKSGVGGYDREFVSGLVKDDSCTQLGLGCRDDSGTRIREEPVARSWSQSPVRAMVATSTSSTGYLTARAGYRPLVLENTQKDDRKNN